MTSGISSSSAGDAEEFDPYAFAERWYEEVWPVEYPIEYMRYTSAVRASESRSGDK